MLFTVEGNIGAGKSTLLTRLMKEQLFSRKHIVAFEPIDEWMNVTPGGNQSLFEMYYQDKAKHGFMFQMFALQTRMEHIDNIFRSDPDKIIICERTHLTDCEIFAKMLYNNKLMTDAEYYVYRKWYDFCVSRFIKQVDGIIYLQASPSTCMERIQKRNRTGEENISIDYITDLHECHESWILKNTGTPACIINGEVGEEELDIDAIVTFVHTLAAYMS